MRTSLGWIAAVSCDGCLIGTSLPHATSEEAASACGVGTHGGEPDAVLRAFTHDVARYFAGERVSFSSYRIAVLHVSGFVRRALQAARQIPYGEVRAYGWLAEKAGNARAARAAGYAMSVNPLPLVVPCHRVIGASGRLTGFGAGLPMKRTLLKLEGVRCSADGVCDV